MQILTISILALFVGFANAHFRLLYPEPRGPFVANIEPNFCGGYDSAVSNRSTFPLTGGVFSISTGHPNFTVGVLLSTVQNPTSFDNFSANGEQQLARQYANEKDAGTFCIPLDIASVGIPGAVDGANVTIQIVFSGGDGNLYQCADLTLSNNYTRPSSISCSNVTATTSSAAPGATSTGHGSSGSVGQVQGLSGAVFLFALGLVGLAFSN